MAPLSSYALLQDIAGTIVTFTLTAISGEPDLAVSTHRLPSAVDYVWRVACTGRRQAKVVVYPSDEHAVQAGSR